LHNKKRRCTEAKQTPNLEDLNWGPREFSDKKRWVPRETTQIDLQNKIAKARVAQRKPSRDLQRSVHSREENP
jgi:hypothetical protein